MHLERYSARPLRTQDSASARRAGGMTSERRLYGPQPQEVSGPDLAALLERVQQYYDGATPPHSAFLLADFRNDTRQAVSRTQSTTRMLPKCLLSRRCADHRQERTRTAS